MRAGGTTAGPAQPSRLTERHVLTLGLAVAAAFVAAAVVVAAAAMLSGGPAWSVIHLALAGGAVTAIGTFMPHFAITLAGTVPEPAPQRLATIGLLAAGGTLAVLGLGVVGSEWSAVGAAAIVAGLGLVAWQTVTPLRSPLARRHPIVTVTYLVALVQLAIGVTLGGLVAAGADPVVAAWATLRPAHAWLTLFGAVSVTIFGTLVYLGPTIVGARIRPSVGLAAGAAGMLSGPMITAAGFALGAVPVVAVGMTITLLGATGQVAYVVDVVRRRGRFTSEHDWRRAAAWHILAGPAWFAAVVVVALAEIVTGRPLAGWSLGPLAIPLVAGWVVQELVGSWTHLAPAVTPGGPGRHAAQRRALARGSRLRPLAWNGGVALAWIGAATGAPAVLAAGAAVLGLVVGASVLLLGRALAVTSTARRGSRRPTRPGAGRPAGAMRAPRPPGDRR